MCHVKVARRVQRPRHGPYSRTPDRAGSELEEPVGDEVPDGARRPPVRTEDLVERGQDLGHSQLTVAGADQGRLGRADRAGAAQAEPLAQHDLTRVLGTRRTERLLHDVRAGHRPSGEEPGV